MSTARASALALVASALLAGCADPYEDEDKRPGTKPTAPGTTGVRGAAESLEPDSKPGERRNPATGDVAPPERRPRRGPLGTSRSNAPGPRALAALFAERSLNWDWRDPDAPYRALLPLALDPLRAEMHRARSAVGLDDSLRRDRAGSRGSFVAIDVMGRGPERRMVVVVREEALLDGRGSLEGPRHRVYLAEAKRTSRGWGMSRWAQQP